MNRKELDEIKAKILEKKEKASDMEKIAAKLFELPYGQLKKVLTDEIMEILKKYGIVEAKEGANE